MKLYIHDDGSGVTIESRSDLTPLIKFCKENRIRHKVQQVRPNPPDAGTGQTLVAIASIGIPLLYQWWSNRKQAKRDRDHARGEQEILRQLKSLSSKMKDRNKKSLSRRKRK